MEYYVYLHGCNKITLKLILIANSLEKIKK